ncbi:basic amino acid ABC transporter substrate-binding protein [Campylobacter sp. JMF_01 NE2]|uniref:basic amino acid ABC transporter substrate-binding protein n=1 Tax=unclassified Campylobacter TaxID=2593542 RepID=UPI0022E9B57D|nr:MULTISPECIES: basic amino acid ABC transporter substrate-binding protein [unclassified Campylobacter]MDA3053472.1 basic amino acid ABC transporter substrate-binding protein [Campylobacter sp. JMF_03 NE3]MDA3067790.1 basic amino acid ABC transporter substrate-binding protein [Campylobacter sp. JMF_01 NE2]
MKKFLKFMLAASLVGSIACAKDVYVMGTNAEYPPFEFVDENSTITGFDIDLVNEISKRADLKIEILNMSFDGLIPALKSGKIDLAGSGMSATAERRNAVDFTNSYYEVENLYIKHKDDDSLKTKDDLKGKRLTAQLGTIQENAIREIPSADVNPAETVFAGVLLVKNKKVDALCVDSSVGVEYLKKNDDIVEFMRESDGSDGFAFAFDKGKYPELVEKFNKAIDEMKADGSYDKLLEKYNLK